MTEHGGFGKMDWIATMKKIRTNSLLIPILSLFVISLLLFSCGGRQAGETRSGPNTANTAPAISSVRIIPDHPACESELTAIVECRDPDGDCVTLRYEWTKNREEIVGENGAILKAGNFRKGDVIAVRVIPTDGKTEGFSVLSPEVRIGNTPPVVQEVRIEPKAPSVRDRLEIRATGFDKDGDTLYYTYQWEKNGEVLPEEKSEFLEAGRFKKRDKIVAIVTADDREAKGSTKKVGPIIIANGPPIIVSSPPGSLEGRGYTYQVKAEDLDEDPIVFALKVHPKGMVIDQKTGVIQWKVGKNDKGNHSVEVEASDPQGAYSVQKFSLAVEVK
jgi:hypothetical protein